MQYILNQLKGIRDNLVLIEARLALLQESNKEASEEEIALIEESIAEVQAESVRLKCLLEEFKKQNPRNT